MTNRRKFLVCLVLLALLATVLLFRRGRPPADVAPASPPKSALAPVRPKEDQPALVLAPRLPAVPPSANSQRSGASASVMPFQPPTTVDAAAPRDVATGFANALQSGDLVQASTYFPPQEQAFALSRLKLLVSSPRGLQQLTQAFAALDGQTPTMNEAGDLATYYDRTIYGPSPPIPLDRLPPGTDPDSVIRIPILMGYRNGRWFISTTTFGTLFAAVNNTPLPVTKPSAKP